MNELIMEALCSFAITKPPEIRNFRICSAIVHKHKEVVSLGYPRRKSHPLQKQFGINNESIYLHAEVDGIIRSLRSGYEINRRDTSIYIARVKRKGPFDFSYIKGNSSPCLGCLGFINHCGIFSIFHTKD